MADPIESLEAFTAEPRDANSISGTYSNLERFVLEVEALTPSERLIAQMMADANGTSLEVELERQAKYRAERNQLLTDRQAGKLHRPEWCICDDGYWMRGLEDPSCRHAEIEDHVLALHQAVDTIAARDAEIEQAGRLHLRMEAREAELVAALQSMGVALADWKALALRAKRFAEYVERNTRSAEPSAWLADLAALEGAADE